MKVAFLAIQILSGILLIGTILLQSQGTGLGKAWGGGGEFYKSRRGVEKIVFSLTTVLAIVFLCVSLLQVVL